MNYAEHLPALQVVLPLASAPLAVLFRDTDGTNSSASTLSADKLKSMRDGFALVECRTGVPMVPKPKSECSRTEQLGVSFLAGYIAGVLCAVVSQPADNLVSKLNAQKGATAGDIIKEMGWFNLFTRGLTVRIAMVGTLTGLQWGIYDAFKAQIGLPTSGGAAPAKK